MHSLKYKFLIPAVLFININFAQNTFSIKNNSQNSFQTAITLFNEHEFSIAYSIFNDLKTKHYSNDNEKYIDYYIIICELEFNYASAENKALQFLHQNENISFLQNMQFHLAHFYFMKGDYENSLKYYSLCDNRNFTNEDIANLKFETAVIYFNQSNFKDASPLFLEITQIKNNKNKIPAYYYLGVIYRSQKEYDNALEAFLVSEHCKPFDKAIPYYITEILYKQNKKDRALIYGDSTLQNNQNLDYELNLKLLVGQLYFEEKKYNKALPLIENYVSKSDKIQKEILYQLSFCYYYLNNTDKAINGFKELSNENDSIGQISMYLLADLYLRIQDKENARNAFQFCSFNNSNYELKRISRFNFAKLSYELGYQNIAINELNKYIKDYTQSDYDLEAKEILINMLTATNNFDDGLALYFSINNPNLNFQKVYPKLLYGKATQLINDQKLDEANELLFKIIANSLSEKIIPFAKFWRGEIAYRQKRYEDAINLLNAFLQSKSENLGDANFTNAKYSLGYSYLQNEENKKALTFFESITSSINKQSTSIQIDAYLRSADCNYLLKEYSKALTKYNYYIDNNLPQADYALYQKAMIAGVKNSTEKIDLLTELSNKFPSSNLIIDAQMEIANTFIDDKKFTSAIPYLNNIISNTNASRYKPSAYFNLGLAYYNNNDNTQSVEVFKNLIREFPKADETQDALQIIKDIYVNSGTPELYISLLRTNGINLSNNEADSLTYITGLKKFENDDFIGAVKSFTDYLGKYINGQYKLEVNFYIGLSQIKIKDINNATKSLTYVNEIGINPYFDEATLQLAKTYYFDLKNYDSSKIYFQSLLENTTDNEFQLEALRGLVRTYYQLNNFNLAKSVCGELLNRKGISTDDKSIALLVLGKSQENSNELDSAIINFKALAQINKSQWGAEARYEIAYCYFKLNNLNAAEKSSMAVIKETGGYDSWVTKSYILIGDIFMKRKDFFNAKATYQSVYKNCKDIEIKKEAEEKYNNAIIEEKKSSKIIQ